ncbi:hypothetical protein J7355_07945 [Endozoicomonas sp. G2_2]|uniref:hypothetical protein n=1 Tax=Endozoicomonas sp. G2_2 TaxID=2821092 RepID=UPI001AD9957E|nr:hypothetical protein [Endozoicomonas sp. G2_2]MBO9470028.1 hypothetical protein [Endozoicomonas sp. G2_2]
MNPAIVRTAFALTLILFTAAAAQAEPAFIERQQSTYHAQRQGWETPDVPAGVDAPTAPVDAYDSGVGGVWVRIRNVDLYFKGDVGFYAQDVTAKLVPETPGTPVDLNDPAGFSVQVAHGCARLSPAQLSALFNDHILDYEPRPLNDLALSTTADTLTINGQIKLWSWFPGFWMPLYLRGPLTLNNGQLVYRPDRIDALKVRAHQVLHLTHIALDQLLSIDRPGVTVGEYAIDLDVTKVFPPPTITTTPDRLNVDDQGVTICFDRAPEVTLEPPADAGDSYIWVQAGDLAALDKLIVNAHVLVEPESGQSMAFSIPDYKAQIARGRLGMRDDGTLVVTLPRAEPDHAVSAD